MLVVVSQSGSNMILRRITKLLKRMFPINCMNGNHYLMKVSTSDPQAGIKRVDMVCMKCGRKWECMHDE